MNKRIFAAVMAALIPMSGITAYAQPAGTNAVVISTVDEFKSFAENCTLDSFSVGKTFVLGADINIAGYGIKPVPSFGGTFDGNGHKITGLNIDGAAGVTGLFRYIEESGTVKNLTVEGKVTPTGTSEKAGGIAGVNRGRIMSCAFDGTVTAKERCGGIAGVNEETGLIGKCVTSGRVQAEHYAGGIVGENYGSVRSCENKSAVNTKATESSIDLEDINIESITSTESVSNVTDAGGIAGSSSGTIQACVNRGEVGYPHIGYNIGGVVGRQDGYVSGCENYGRVLGRKDTGGIVGQAEPHFMISYSKEHADALKQSLDELNGLIDGTITDMQQQSDSVGAGFDGLNATLSDIREKSGDMLDEADRIVNADIESVNEISTRLSDFTDMLGDVTDTLSDSALSLSRSLGMLGDAGRLLAESGESLDSGLELLFDSTGNLSDAAEQLSAASSSLGDALTSLKDGLGDPESMKAAVNALREDISAVKFIVNSIADNSAALISAAESLKSSPEMRDAANEIESALKAIQSTSNKLSGDLDKLSAAVEKINKKLDEAAKDPDNYDKYLKELEEMLRGGLAKELGDAAKAVGDDVSKLMSALADLSGGLSDVINSRALKRFKSEISAAAGNIADDMEHISDITDSSVTMPATDIDALYMVIDYLKNATDGVSASGQSVKDALEIIEGSWEDIDAATYSAIAAAYKASDAADEAENAAAGMSDAAAELSRISDYFGAKPDVTFVGADDGFIESREQLESSLSGITRDLETLNLRAQRVTDVLAEDLRAINDKCAEIKDILFEIADEVKDVTLDPEDYTEDVSVSGVNTADEGVVVSCVNYGAVEADVNVGGIAGAMGVENSFDPESDNAETIGERSVKFTYMLRTVVYGCDNYGSVTAKKDGVGGIAGEMATGCVARCGGFGDVSSASGGYVGGVVGISAATVMDSFAMCRLDGGDYIGGIAGSAHDMTGCRAFAKIKSGDEFVGAVAGNADGSLSGNVFVEDDSGAVDGVSYSGKAYPVSYDKMLTLANVPGEFRKMKLIFTADGEEVAEIECDYGGKVRESALPAIPEKAGYYAKWADFDMENVRFGEVIEAEYYRLSSASASEVTREDGLPVIIAEGAFGGDEKPIAEYDGVSWHVTIPDDGAESHVVRFYCEREPEKTDILINGAVTPSEPDGKYTVFTVSLNDFNLSTADKPFNYIPIAIGGGAAAALIVVVFAVRHSKKKKRADEITDSAAESLPDKPKEKQH